MYDEDNPDGLAVFQDMTKQIRAFAFKQSQFEQVKNQKYADNAGIYFLFSEDEDLKKSLYWSVREWHISHTISYYK